MYRRRGSKAVALCTQVRKFGFVPESFFKKTSRNEADSAANNPMMIPIVYTDRIISHSRAVVYYAGKQEGVGKPAGFPAEESNNPPDGGEC